MSSNSNGSSNAQAQGKNWVFTLNNYTEACTQALSPESEIWRNHERPAAYFMWKREIGENGTKHLQGLICFTKRYRFNLVKSFFHDLGGKWGTCHIETMRGTLKQAESYIQKKDTTDPSNPEIVVGGTRPSSQGDRTEMGAIIEGLRSGKTESELLSDDTEGYIKYSTGIRRAIQIRDSAVKRKWKTEVYWMYGPTGTGKSELAYAITDYNAYNKNCEHNWWCGYEGHDDVIMNDYRPSMCMFNTLLNILDRYPMQLQVKGGSANFKPKRIFITTPKNPYDTWHNRSEEDLSQLTRRITEVVRFQKNKAPWSETNNCVWSLYKPEFSSFSLPVSAPPDSDDETSVIHEDDSPITKRRKTAGAFVDSFNP